MCRYLKWDGGFRSSQAFLESPVSLICFVVFCLILEVIVIVFIYLIMKNIFYVEKIYLWEIYDYVPPPPKQHVSIPILNENIEFKNGKLLIKKPTLSQVAPLELG